MDNKYSEEEVSQPITVTQLNQINRTLDVILDKLMMVLRPSLPSPEAKMNYDTELEQQLENIQKRLTDIQDRIKI